MSSSRNIVESEVARALVRRRATWDGISAWSRAEGMGEGPMCSFHARHVCEVHGERRIYGQGESAQSIQREIPSPRHTDFYLALGSLAI